MIVIVIRTNQRNYNNNNNNDNSNNNNNNKTLCINYSDVNEVTLFEGAITKHKTSTKQIQHYKKNVAYNVLLNYHYYNKLYIKHI